MYSADNHTFALCAYKESPFLEECLRSLTSQEVASRVLVATATPNDHIKSLCEAYAVPLFINPSEPGISSDWNFAMSCAKTSLVTIAHQDDVYEPQYSRRMLDAVNSSKKPLLYFTDYGELRNGIKVDSNVILKVKRAMLFPLRSKAFRGSRFVRRRVLSLGSAICCPSVTMVTHNLPAPIFSDELKCDLDWQAWERLSRLEGDFLYDSAIMMRHRIHEDSETTALIRDDTRTREDLYMLEHFWPRPIARLLGKAYVLSQNSNK